MKAKIYVHRAIVRKAGTTGLIDGKPAEPLSMRTCHGTTRHRNIIFKDFAVFYDPSKCPRVWIETDV